MLFGIAGRARNGKTTIADRITTLAAKRNCVPVTYDIGALILKHCKAEGLIPQPLLREELSPEQVQTLVRVGLEKRNEDPLFWIRQIEEDYRHLQNLENPKGPFFVAVIPNMRFANELELVKRLGGKTIKISRLNEDGSPFIPFDRDPNHPSETELLHINADYHVTAKPGQIDLLHEIAHLIYNRESALQSSRAV